ncbi:MAG: VWA domain-containing protein [Synergistaceae bacterium]|nr:VWA domain-containing protein [Synergistaceae bacterium]MBR2208536.1 VWA domain-containing protein [Synergistaceae bacterium]
MSRRNIFRNASSLKSAGAYSQLPISLCLDTSGSMRGHPINELNAGMRLFYDYVKKDYESRYAADISIVSFGFNGVQCIQDFAHVDEISAPASLKAEGMTPMGEAVNLSLDMLENRRNYYRNVGVSYYHPWLILMTDGDPNGVASELSRAIGRTRDLVNNNKLVVFPIAIGNQADVNTLAQFSPKMKPVALKGLNFKGFFEWLSVSVHSVSVSNPGDSIPLPKIDNNWGSIII